MAVFREKFSNKNKNIQTEYSDLYVDLFLISE
ncbi:hypothetical protein LI7559_15555 [Bacillus licheniformis LMG 7559]|nr:hypothetical protein LI7559_15555 [Bacillus licheniformis LMG 7559]KUL15156.1 hypothetical protein LI6934_21555 [Bacillus licheniformis LMG 6934]